MINPAPNPIDTHVGARVRLARKMQDVTQQALAEQLGLTFQQVQKYERGTNRISASKLYEAARALGVPVDFFFEGLANPSGAAASTPEQLPPELVNTPEGLELAAAFLRVTKRVRGPLVKLVRDIGRGESD